MKKRKKLNIKEEEIVEYKGNYPILVLFLGLAGIVTIVVGLCIGIMYLLKWIF